MNAKSSGLERLHDQGIRGPPISIFQYTYTNCELNDLICGLILFDVLSWIHILENKQNDTRWYRQQEEVVGRPSHTASGWRMGLDGRIRIVHDPR